MLKINIFYYMHVYQIVKNIHIKKKLQCKKKFNLLFLNYYTRTQYWYYLY